jgi:transcriptional regulator with XRE-family HTH domain
MISEKEKLYNQLSAYISARLDAGATQASISRDIGIQPTYVCQLAAGNRLALSLERLIELNRAAGLSVTIVIGGANE